VADGQETESPDLQQLTDAAAEAGALIKDQVQSIIGEAEQQAEEIRSNAEREAQHVRQEASEHASRRAESIVDGAESRAHKILADADKEASRARREAFNSAERVLDRARSRVIKHADAVERELQGLLAGLRRDAESLAADLDRD
jgi:vacuolar-type H+-ATPase subunit H